VQQSGYLQFVAVTITHRETPERPDLAGGHGFRQQHGQRRHTLAMPPVYGDLSSICGVDHLDKRFEQALQVVDQQPVRQCDRRLRGQ